MKKFDLFVAAYKEPLLKGVSAETAVKELISLNGGRIVHQYEGKIGIELCIQPTYRPTSTGFVAGKIETCYEMAIDQLFTNNIKESK